MSSKYLEIPSLYHVFVGLKFKIKKVFPQISRDLSSLVSNSRMEELSPTTTFRRSPLFIWFLDSEEVVWDKSRSSQPLPHSLESTNVRRWSAENVMPSSQLRPLTAERESAVTGVTSDQRRRLRDEPSWRSLTLASCILRCLSSHQEILQRCWF